MPRNLYYLAIDGTSAIDSVAYGELLEKDFGWKNLVGEFLKPRTDDATLLLDPKHPFLPICVYPAKTTSKAVAVVCPAGRESLGKDSIWQRYAGEHPHEAPDGTVKWPEFGATAKTVGRHSAGERSAAFMSSLISDPAIEVQLRKGVVVPQLVDLEDPDRIIPLEEDVFRADLLVVSSHGWLGGFMRGNQCPDWPDAEPEEARKAFVPGHPYYMVGEAVENHMGFFGPRWIVLAQCSTVNTATFPLWVKVLGRSSPPVRGILAYEEVSPGPRGSIAIARSFFAHLKTKPIVDAWIAANQGQKWAAIVHKEARHDRMAEWRSFKDPSSVQTTATTASYVGLLRSIPQGKDILDVPPPFGLELASTDPTKSANIQDPPPSSAQWDPITPALLHRGRAMLQEQWSRLLIDSPDAAGITGAKVLWIHIRPTYSKQPGPNKLFQQIRVPPGEELAVDVSIVGKDIKLRRTSGSGTRLTLLMLGQPSAVYPTIGLEQHHAYIWPRVEITLSDGRTLKHDFMTTGLSF